MMATEKSRREVEALFRRRNIKYVSLGEETEFRWRVVLKSKSADTSVSEKLVEGLHSSIVVERSTSTSWIAANQGWDHHVIFFFKDHFANTFAK